MLPVVAALAKVGYITVAALTVVFTVVELFAEVALPFNAPVNVVAVTAVNRVKEEARLVGCKITTSS